MTLKQALGKMKWKNFFFLTVAGYGECLWCHDVYRSSRFVR